MAPSLTVTLGEAMQLAWVLQQSQGLVMLCTHQQRLPRLLLPPPRLTGLRCY
jgi:hypothetical protein